MPILKQAFPPQIKGRSFLEYCWRETRNKNSNVIFFITGLPGKGKTTAALSLMWLLDRDYLNRPRADLRNFVFTQKQFIQAVNRNKDDTGRVIIWEEPYAAGLIEGGANARDFMKVANKRIATLFGTMRKNNHVILLTLPNHYSFDKQARSVAHGLLHITNNDGEYCYGKAYFKSFNPIFSKEYFIFLRRNEADGRCRVSSFQIGSPPKEFWDLATAKSNFFKDKWAKEINEVKVVRVKSPMSKRFDFMKAVREAPENYKVVRRGKEIWDYGKIAKQFRTSYSTANHWVREFEA